MPHTQIHGAKIYYQQYGRLRRDRPTVVFLHDGLGSSRSWKEIPRMIGDRSRLNALAYDRLGYGRASPWKGLTPGFIEREIPYLHALLDNLKLGSVHLVGHSDGASIAMVYAIENPERVHSVVSVAGHTFVEQRTLNRIKELMREAESGNLPRGMKKQYGHRASVLLKSWAAAWLTHQHARWDIRGKLRRLSCPVFVIQGEEDEFGSLAQVTSVLESVPGARRWVLSGCGHLPHIDHKEAFVARVVDFLKAVPTPPSR